MLEIAKKKFSDLLERIQSTGFDSFTDNKMMIEDFYKDVTDEYHHIQFDIFKIRENLNVISSILEACSHNNSDDKYCNDDMKYLIDKTIGNVNDFFSYEMAERLISFNIAKGKWFFEQQRFDEALDAWEEVLKVNPCNEYIHSKLHEMVTNCV